MCVSSRRRGRCRPRARARPGSGCARKSRGRLQQFYEAYTQRKISVWEVDARRAAEIWREIEAFRPDFILGYTSVLADIADELRSRGLPLSRRPRGVITAAEVLTPARRSAIERYFHGADHQPLRLARAGFVERAKLRRAPESFHINTELVVCEILRDDGSPAEPGEIGRVVLTDLWNFARPFIRYFTGDLAVAAAGACACGRGFPLMGPIDGRSQECLHTVSGKILSPAVLGHYVCVYHGHHEAIREYQLVQDAPDQVRLLVVPSSAWQEKVGKLIQQRAGKFARRGHGRCASKRPPRFRPIHRANGPSSRCCRRSGSRERHIAVESGAPDCPRRKAQRPGSIADRSRPPRSGLTGNDTRRIRMGESTSCPTSSFNQG